MITVLAGGVGAARLLAGLVQVADPSDVTAIVNTADDEVINGLSISPDLDTVTYTLAEAIDPARGWGLAGESWQVMEALERYVHTRPELSRSANTWFRLGDRDLATHLYRSARLSEGADLTTVTHEITRAWNVNVRLIPMTNDPVSTKLTVANINTDSNNAVDEIGFQEYFVRLQHNVEVASIRFKGSDLASPNPLSIAAIQQSDRIVIAPSNPFLSIAPILSLAGIRQEIAERRDDVVAISPIIDGAAIKGPADRLMRELGHDSSVVGVANIYRDIASTLIIDNADEHHRASIERTGMRCVVSSTIMRTRADAASLAKLAVS